MKTVFVSVGTSLFDRGLLGPREALRSLRDSSVVAAWDEAATVQGGAELSAAEAESRFSAALEAAGRVTGDGTADLRPVLDRLPERVRLFRDAFVAGGDEAEKKMLSAELASLCRLLPRYPLATEDRLVLLATDSPAGRLAGHVLGEVLHRHPVLGGAAVEVAWPRHWQIHDGNRLAERGASNLLAAVSRLLADDLRARPLFVVTGGLKLGITVMSQVSCWNQVAGHDGLFFKLEDPGGFFFPPCSFVERATGHVLLPHFPTTERLRGEVAFTSRLRELADDLEPPRWEAGPAPLTTLVVTVGVGLVRARPGLLEARFGKASPLAEKTTWDAVDRHALCRSWEELRSERDAAPTDADLADAVDRVTGQLRGAWHDGHTADLPAELAALRSLWIDTRHGPAPLLRGPLRVVLLATDSLTGEYCASLVAGFLEQVDGIVEVAQETVRGFHPFGGSSNGGAFFEHMTEIVAAAASDCERLLMVPLGGTKLHLPLLTVLATRLRAPIVLGHVGLGGNAALSGGNTVVVPWLECEAERGQAERVAPGDLTAVWPELTQLPTVRLEVEGG